MMKKFKEFSKIAEGYSNKINTDVYTEIGRSEINSRFPGRSYYVKISEDEVSQIKGIQIKIERSPNSNRLDFFNGEEVLGSIYKLQKESDMMWLVQTDGEFNRNHGRGLPILYECIGIDGVISCLDKIYQKRSDPRNKPTPEFLCQECDQTKSIEILVEDEYGTEVAKYKLDVNKVTEISRDDSLKGISDLPTYLISNSEYKFLHQKDAHLKKRPSPLFNFYSNCSECDTESSYGPVDGKGSNGYLEGIDLFEYFIEKNK